jgi:hypothetical protein
MYRLDRPRFRYILGLIREDIASDERGLQQAAKSSGFPVSPTIKLAVALRIAAVGSYLDIAFGYRVNPTSVFSYFHEVFAAIDKRLKNIKFPKDEDELRRLEATFAPFLGPEQVAAEFSGTVAAGDGVVFRMQKPQAREVGGNVTGFFQRKGYYAYGLQAFCDGKCRFVFVASQVCTASHDSTAYAATSLSHHISTGGLAAWAHVVVDAAYKCTEQELSPYKGKNLPEDKDAFNYYLSLRRQVIERAFGMLVQRWGILWRPLRMNMEHIAQTVRVCCKLHNVCIDTFDHAGPVELDVAEGDRVWQRGRMTHERIEEPDFVGLGLQVDNRRQGARSDLGSRKRKELTEYFRVWQIKRPKARPTSV